MDQKNRDRPLYTLQLISFALGTAISLAHASVAIEADKITVNYGKKIITASGNVAVNAPDIQAQTPYIKYDYFADSVIFSGDSSIQYKQNHLKGSDFVVKLKDNSIVSSEKSSITIQLD